MDTRFPPYQGTQQQQNGAYGSTATGTGMGGAVPAHRPVPPGMQMGMGGRTSSSGSMASSMGQSQMQGMGRMVGNQQMYGGGAQAQGGRGDYGTSPQGLGRAMQSSSYQQQSNMVGNDTASASFASGRAGPFVPPSGDLLSMLNSKGNGLSQPSSDNVGLSMSDFPSLGGVPATSQRSMDTSGPDAAGVLLGKMPKSPTFGEEDFPALPGAPVDPRRASQQGMQQAQRIVQRPIQTFANGPNDLAKANQGISRKPDPVIPGISVAKDDKYGLLGLLNVIRMTDPDLTTLALGTDLTTLGLNLNSPDPLWKTFVSPWAEGPSKQEVDPRIPDSFIAPSPQMTREHWYHFKPDTLFYNFFGRPGEESQIRAAAELTRRGWLYHKELKAWITRVPNSEPEQKSDRLEVGSFLVFDVLNWEVIRKDGFTLSFDAIEESPATLVTSK